ncbi:MAG: PAS domain S-box protein [Sedimentisphaerales bacterium]|jgi:PAS domain S-box-containing protein
MNDSDKTKEQLVKEIELLRTLIDALPDRLYVKDAKGRFVICNKAVAEDTDHPFSENPIGKSDFDLFPPELAGTLYAAEQEIIKTGKPMVNEEAHRIRPKDGKINWSLCTKMPWRDKNGNIIGIIGANRDITKRKNAELALLESENKYKAMFESAKEGILIVDVETKRPEYANPAICKMYGYTEEELCQKTIYDIHTSDRAKIIEESFSMHEQNKRGRTRLNVPCIRKDGTVFFADIKIVAVFAEQKMRHLVFFTDTTERKIVEDALRESEARYRAIFESVKEGIIVGIIETRQFVYVNPAICKMFGYTAEELTRLSVKDIHPKEHLQYVSGRFEALMRSEVAFTQDIPCLRKNGTVFYADISATRTAINGKNYFVGFFTDITERKQVEDDLRESEVRYKAIFDYATEGIIIADIETKRLKYANQAACAMFGYTAEQFQHITVHDMHPKEYMPSVLARFEILAQGEKTHAHNAPCLRKDGTVFYANINSTRVIIDQRPCNVGLFTDITEHKHAEEALRQSEEKFRGMAERSSEMIFTTDTRGLITYLSPASKKIFGYKPQEMVGKNFTTFLVESEIPKAVKRFREKLQGKNYGVLYLQAKRKNRSRVFIELNSSLIIQKGKIAGTQGTIKDVTERKKTEEQLKKAHEELEIRVKKRTAELAKAVETLKTEIIERKHAEESLRNAEVRFRSVFENTIVGLYRTTPAGRILLANPALIKMMGCRSFKQLTKFNVEKNGFDPSTPRSIFKKLIKKEGRVIGLESIWRRPDGTKLFVSESAFAVKDAKGKILYYEGTAQNITKRKEAEEKLMLYQQQLRSLASELSLAEERLRRRIAAELHDHIAQNLAISKIKLESLKDDVKPDLVKSLKDVIDLISQTIDASRSLTFEISPPVLYELGFEAAVGWLVRQTRQRFGLDVEFINDEKPKPLNADIRVLLFQAVRELLVNVVKHAKAKKTKVYVHAVNDNIQVAVEDNGVGFDITAINPAKDFTKGGFGLFNIRERLDQIGGSVIIHSGQKKGTQIILTAPMEKLKKPRIRFSGARSGKNGRRRKN